MAPVLNLCSPSLPTVEPYTLNPYGITQIAALSLELCLKPKSTL